jgi:flagellar protein FliL
MSEAKQEGAPKSKKGLLLIIVGVVLLVVLLLVGVLAFLLLRGNPSPAEEHAVEQVEAPKQEKKAKKEDKATPPVFEKLGLFTVNLNSQESDEKMQVDLTVELANEADKAKLKLYQPKLQSAVIQLLRSKTPEEVKQPDSQEKLGLEIKDVLNKILEADGKDEGVLSVNFTSFIVA